MFGGALLPRRLGRLGIGGPGPRRGPAGDAGSARQADRGQARPGWREGGDGRRGGRGAVRWARPRSARAAERGRPRSGGAARLRVTDQRALLEEIAGSRLVGTTNHTDVRAVLKREPAARGFVVMEQRLRARPRPPLWGPGPADAINLIAVRPRARVLTWLAAHYDPKRQPISMAARLVLAATLVVALLAASVTLLAGGSTLILAVPVGVAALFLVLNRVSAGFPGRGGNLLGVPTGVAIVGRVPPLAGAGVGFLR